MVSGLVESLYAVSPEPGMAGLHCLLDHPCVLADGAPAGASMARERGIALPRPGPCVDPHVDWNRCPDMALEEFRAVFHAMDVDSGRAVVCRELLHLFALWRALQLGAVGWPTRSSEREPAAKACY